jgi:lipopolysaccharide export system protein LptA
MSFHPYAGSIWLAILVIGLSGSVAADEPERAGTPPSDPSPMFKLQGLQPDQPLEIESEELEVLGHDGGGRRLLFSRGVRVVQGDVILTAEFLEAIYPATGSEPERLRAWGGVRVEQAGRKARCSEAEYDRKAQLIVCRGDAELIQGCDVVRGESIELDLARNRAKVLGGARVLIWPDSSDPEARLACQGDGS